MRRRLALLLLLALATPAHGQAKKRRAQPLAPPPAEAPPAPRRQTPLPAGRLTLTGLPQRADGLPACRALCARARYACEGGDDDCATPWTQCVRTCAASPARPR